LVKAAGHVRVLQHLAWPFEAEEAFLSAWHAGRSELHEVRLEPIGYGFAADALESIAALCDRGHPLQPRISTPTSLVDKLSAETPE
jgi:hypothetical protein